MGQARRARSGSTDEPAARGSMPTMETLVLLALIALAAAITAACVHAFG
jgi:hypothetical protein